MIRLKYFAYFVLLVAASLVVPSFLVQAQNELELPPMYLMDIPIVDGLITSVPDDWLLWNRSDFETVEEANAAYVDLQSIVLNTDQFAEPHLALKIMALSPSGNAFIRVEVSDIASFSESIGWDGDLELYLLFSALSTSVTDAEGVNPPMYILGHERLTLWTRSAESMSLLSIQIMDEMNQVVGTRVVYIGDEFSNRVLAALFILSNLVRQDEVPLDLEEFESYLDATGVGMPENITIADVEGAEIGDNETQDETEPDTEDTESERTDTISCSVRPANNANLRGGPGTAFAVAGSLAGGTSSDAIGQATGSDGMVWWQLSNGNWVRSDVVQETGDCDLLPETTP